MSIFTKLGVNVAAPFNADGTPRQISPQDFQIWMTEVERLIKGLIANAGGVDLPELIYKYLITGGDENNIIGQPNATPPTGAGEALFTIEITEPNTGNVTINGKQLLTSSGSQIAPSGLVPGVWAFLDDGINFRLLSDQASQSIVQLAESAAAEALAAKAAAESAAGNNWFAFDAISSVKAVNIPISVNYVRTAGYYTAGDGGGAIYKRVTLEPVHAAKIQSADGAWWELAEAAPLITMFGAIADGVTDVSDRWQDALNYTKLRGSGLGGNLGVPNNGNDYVVKKTLVFPINCVIEVRGIGMPRVRFQPPATDVLSDFIKMGNGVYSQSINILRDMVIWGNGATGKNCITGQYLSNLKLYDVFMYNFVGWCVDVADCYCFSMVGGQAVGDENGLSAGGIRLTRASGNQGLLSHVRVNGFKGANKTGLTIAGDGTNTHYGMRIDNCAFEFNNLGIFVNAARGLTIDTCYFEFNTEANITANGGADNLIQSLSFLNNALFEGGCTFINARGLTVSGNSFQHNSNCYIEDKTGSYQLGINTFTNGGFVFSNDTPRKSFEKEAAWLSFASTWISGGTQPSLGNGSLAFKYKRSGNTVECVVTLIMGSTTTYGNNGYGFRLPFNVAAGAVHIGKSGCYKANTDGTTLNMSALCSPGDNYVSLRNDAGGVVGPKSPIDFGAGDKIYASFTYECVSS